jgi:hypothetical protein
VRSLRQRITCRAFSRVGQMRIVSHARATVSVRMSHSILFLLERVLIHRTREMIGDSSMVALVEGLA